ncbi:MAG TPA: dTDP-4-amino-4,6-dideoxy-D-glucose ammonia-lyase [Amycolatopsis sp.]|uniref:dTDP-4-amino-4,6-dideoxy-D-glucose ammonia-lyase n=1 Tax=Amycolatopsis sp. TaxID=37632 RepID=UPI002B498976|nr:dTDP-4-amino-4,6-dideoxy-D-glucose ammonia-lyase [Amycolatopsis sp.]HKS50127.1 dTDP-4-amino-4,6-dideoxy-D-glucose ammonia-lyase [Amycolatopsis sp.]
MTSRVTATPAALGRQAIEAVEGCALPGFDRAEAVTALAPLLRTGDAARLAHELVWLATTYGNEPFLPLETARAELGVDRARLEHLLIVFAGLPQLRTAVLRGPAGKYWSNTILPLERAGVLDPVLAGNPAFPRLVGIYPGPTCMFRCHFCVRVTGARYQHELIDGGNALFAKIVDEPPSANPFGMYISGGLEPLTNPGLGELISRAAARGFNLTLYTNSFALTEATLARQPGIWQLHALRTSLYGLDDEEYRATTGKPGAFSRVERNLLRFQRLRLDHAHPIQLGLNYIVLPGRVGRLPQLADFVARLNAAAPDRPVEFVTLREDYSGRPDGAITADERDEMRAALATFDERVRQLTPTLRVDYGYALHALRLGANVRLPRVGHEEMRPGAHPQVAVQVDLHGDVYLYREAGFPGLTGAERYIAGRVTASRSLGEVIDRFVTERRQVEPVAGDEYFMDGFDQVVTARLRQLEDDIAAGWRARRGFLR